MTRKKRIQDVQPIVAEETTVKKKSPKKKKVVEETKVTKASSDEDILIMEVFQEDAANSGTEKKDKFIELFGKERFTEIFEGDYLKDDTSVAEGDAQEESILTLEEMLRIMPSNSDKDEDDKDDDSDVEPI